MGEQTGTTGGAARPSGGVFTRGFLPGLVLGVVIGAVVGFLSTEIIGKTPKLEPHAGPAPAATARDEEGLSREELEARARQMAEEMVEEGEVEPPADEPAGEPTPEDDG